VEKGGREGGREGIYLCSMSGVGRKTTTDDVVGEGGREGGREGWRRGRRDVCKTEEETFL